VVIFRIHKGVREQHFVKHCIKEFKDIRVVLCLTQASELIL